MIPSAIRALVDARCARPRPWWLALVVLAAPGCARPTVDSVVMEIQRIDFTGVDMEFDVTVSNPLPLDLEVPEGGYSVAVAGHEVVESDSVPTAVLPSGGSTRIRLPVSLGNVDILRLANKLRGRSRIPYELRGRLVVPVAGQALKVPFAHDGDVPMLSLPAIAVRETGLADGVLSVVAELRNPNAFPIDVAELAYGMTLPDGEVVRLQAGDAGTIPAGGALEVVLRGRPRGAAGPGRPRAADARAVVDILAGGALKTPYGSAEVTEEARSVRTRTTERRERSTRRRGRGR